MTLCVCVSQFSSQDSSLTLIPNLTNALTNFCTDAHAGTRRARESADSESVMPESIPADLASPESCYAQASFASSGSVPHGAADRPTIPEHYPAVNQGQ